MTPSGPPGEQDDRERDDSYGGRGRPATGPAGELGRYAGHGLTIALSTALFAWLGTWADDRLGTAPALVLVGVFVGFGAGFYGMMRDLDGGGAGEDDPGTGR